MVTKRRSLWEERPVITLLVLLLSILLTESCISLLVHEFGPTLSIAMQIFIDVFLLSIILFPFLYTLVLKPLTRLTSLHLQTEAELGKSEERAQILAESLHNFTLEIGNNLRLKHMGSTLSSFLGYQPQDVIGIAAADFLTAASRQTFTRNLAKVLAEQKHSGSNSVVSIDEYELLRKNGSTVWAEVTATALFTKENQPERTIGVFRDISDRKQAESSLRQAHLLLQKTISSLNEAVFIVNTDSRRIEDINICAEEMFGYAREELINTQTSILHLNEEMYQWCGNEITRSYQEKGYLQTNYKMKRKDGTVFPSEHYVSPILNEDGSYHCHVCVVRDISERVRAEEMLDNAFTALAERKNFVESILSNLQSGIIVTDAEMKITMANPYVQNLCRIPSDKIVGMVLQDLCPEIASQVIAGVHANEILATFHETELTVGFTRFDLKNADSIPVGHIINFRDLTEVVKIRAKIQQKERLSAMGEVVAGVAHEMRNPLFGMTTVGQILDMELTLSPAHRQLMDSFMQESRRLNNLVQDLLDGTRELKLRKKLFDLRSVIKASVQVCQKFIQEKNIDLAWERANIELKLHADPDKLEQVFVNLIHNAIDASEPGGKIEINLVVNAKDIAVMIIDSGHGIPEKIMPRIFDVFFTSKKAGTGMGLCISKNIAEGHGGSLKAENLPGKGAKFTLTLPQDGDQS